MPDTTGERQGASTGCQRPSEIRGPAGHGGDQRNTWVLPQRLPCLATQSKSLCFSGPESAHPLPPCLWQLTASNEIPKWKSFLAMKLVAELMPAQRMPLSELENNASFSSPTQILAWAHSSGTQRRLDCSLCFSLSWASSCSEQPGYRSRPLCTIHKLMFYRLWAASSRKLTLEKVSWMRDTV